MAFAVSILEREKLKVIYCTGIQTDPLFSQMVQLLGVEGVVERAQPNFRVTNWSIPKNLVVLYSEGERASPQQTTRPVEAIVPQDDQAK